MFESIKAWFARFRTKLHIAQEKLEHEKGTKQAIAGGADMTPVSPVQVTEPVETVKAQDVIVENPDNPILVQNPIVAPEVVAPAVEPAPKKAVPPRKAPAKKAPAKNKTTTTSTTPARKAPAKSAPRKTKK